MKLFKVMLVCGLMLCKAPITAERITPGALSTQLRQANLEQTISNIQSYQTEQLIEVGQQLLIDETESIIKKERLLMAVIRSASAQEPSEQLIEFTRRLSGYESQVEVMVQDGGHRQAMTAFPIGSHARAMLIDWRQRDVLAEILSDGNLDFSAIAQFLKEHNGQEADTVWSRLIASLDKDNVRLLEETIDLAELTDSQVVALANATGSLTSFDALLERINSADEAVPAIHHSIQSLASRLDAQEAKDVLIAIEADSPYASSAISSLSKFEQDEQTQQHLLGLLGHPGLGGDAAFALAPQLNVALIAQLEKNLMSDDKYLQRRSALTLKQSAHPLAKQVLVEFADNNRHVQFAQEGIR